jgi:hypothetical protein
MTNDQIPMTKQWVAVGPRAQHAEPGPARVDIPVTPSHPPAPKPRPRIILAWLIVPCLACDFLMVPAISSLNGPPSVLHVAFVFGTVGCVLAQGCLLAAFLAWSDGPFLWRLRVHWLVALGLYLIWLVGLVLAFYRDPGAPNMAASVALGVPLVSVAAQFPLWLARQFWGWRLVREQADHMAADMVADRKLAIRDLMLATLVVAVSLALARLAPLDGKDKDPGPPWLVACVVASVISSITLLPAGAWLMRPVGQTFLSAAPLRGLVWSILYAAAWIALVWIIVAAQWWFALPLAPRAIYVGISSLMFTFASTLILTALIARSRGYRLTGGRNRLPHSEGL